MSRNLGEFTRTMAHLHPKDENREQRAQDLRRIANNKEDRGRWAEAQGLRRKADNIENGRER